ncbi:hypothetical protein [Lentzea roselyniae]|uniref:hypothetical protein n=1 Tax=Lentzea roselyniae TaxID=531940 RepID=UPI0031F8E436
MTAAAPHERPGRVPHTERRAVLPHHPNDAEVGHTARTMRRSAAHPNDPPCCRTTRTVRRWAALTFAITDAVGPPTVEAAFRQHRGTPPSR